MIRIICVNDSGPGFARPFCVQSIADDRAGKVPLGHSLDDSSVIIPGKRSFLELGQQDAFNKLRCRLGRQSESSGQGPIDFSQAVIDDDRIISRGFEPS